MRFFRENPSAYLPAGFEIFGLEIRFYSLFILLGIIIAIILGKREAKKMGISGDVLFNGAVFGIIFGIIGARIYYVIFEWGYYSQFPGEIFAIWRGGLAIHGGIIGAMIFVYFYTKREKVSFLKILDIVAIGLLIGQIFGRWGNFFNQEAHGAATTYEFLKYTLHLPDFIVKQMYFEGSYWHPTFLYESLWNLFILVVLLILRRVKSIRLGDIFPIYLIWYSIGRFFIEGMRTDSLMIGSLKQNQVISIVLIVFAIAFLVVKYVKFDCDFYVNYLDVFIDVIEEERIDKTEKERNLIRRRK